MFGVCLALVYVTLFASGVPALWRWIGFWPTAILLSILGVGLYFVGVWAAVDRPAELDKKIPVNSKELRRRRKQFYDWLTSMGRH